MGMPTFLAASYVACLLRAIGYWVRICKAQGTNSLFVDHSPLVLYVGILEHKAIQGVVVVIPVRFCTPRTPYFSDFGITLLFWGCIFARCGLLMLET